jgi:DNA-binding transcriptional ArsR family regulator
MDRETLERYLAEGLSLPQIAARVGRHSSTVGYWITKLGLIANGRNRYAPKGRIERDVLARLVRDGLTLREMAEALDVSVSTVRHWLRRHGMETVRARRPLTFTADGGTMGDGYYRCAKCRSEHVARRRRKVKDILVEEAGGSCRLCGYDRYAGALEFHHLDSAKKSFSLGHKGVTRSLELAREEARKCILLCANCHAEVEGGILKVA